MTENRPIKTDAEYLFQEPCSKALIELRAEIIGQILLERKLGIKPEESDE